MARQAARSIKAPPRQSLGADDPPCRQIHLGLEQRNEPVIGHGLAKFNLELDERISLTLQLG